MYIIEKLIKTYKNLTEKRNKTQVQDMVDNYELEDVVTCNHNFLPIDSTGEMLACSKCGYLISKEKLIRTSFK